LQAQEWRTAEPGVREIRLALAADTSFDDIVEVLRKVWVVPELPGIRGCDPCRSGIDRFIIEDPAFSQFR
jgi:hypothetical protein